MSKHIVIISDGDPTPPSSRVISQLAASKVTVTTVLTAAHGNDPGAIEHHAEPRRADQGPVLQRHQPEGPAADLPEGGAVDLAAADLRAGASLAAQGELPDHRADHGPARATAGDHRAGPDLAQGERAGRDADRLAAAGRPGQPGAGPLDLRAGPLGRLHQRRRPALGQDLARLGETTPRFWSQVIRWSMRPADRGNLTSTSGARRGGSRSSSTPWTRTTSSSTSSGSRGTWSTPT